MPIGKWKDFAACVVANKGKVRNAEAYCASIERQVIGKVKMAKRAAAGRRKYSKGAIKHAARVK